MLVYMRAFPEKNVTKLSGISSEHYFLCYHDILWAVFINNNNNFRSTVPSTAMKTKEDSALAGATL